MTTKYEERDAEEIRERAESAQQQQRLDQQRRQLQVATQGLVANNLFPQPRRNTTTLATPASAPIRPTVTRGQDY